MRGRTFALVAMLLLALLGPGIFRDTPTLSAAGAAVSGTVWAWGLDNYGQLGDSTVGDGAGGAGSRATPAQVAGLTGLIAVGGGEYDSIALKSDGTVWTWGGDGFGELGDGTVANPLARPTPIQVVNLTGVTKIAAGRKHNLALKSDGTVWAWGFDVLGQVGDGVVANPLYVPTPSQVVNLTSVTAIAGGSAHSLALKSDGTVWGWGNNDVGQLGDGNPGGSSPTPVQVSGLTGVIAIASGYDHSLAVKSDGTVWAWGLNSASQIGNGTDGGSKPTPVQVSNLTGVIAVSAGNETSMALKSDGTVWDWGNDNAGQLGDGTVGDGSGGYGVRSTPVKVVNLTGVTAIVAGPYHGMALKNDGTVWAWGNDNAGQLGDGTISNPTSSATPTKVNGLSGVTAIADGFAHSLAIMPPPCVSGFSDVPSSNPACAAIAALSAQGIIRGYTSSTFGPDEPVQRAQVAAFTVRALHWQNDASGPKEFTDFGPLVGELKTASLILANKCDNTGLCVARGYDAASCAAKQKTYPCFGPNDQVSYAQVISFVARAFQFDPGQAWVPQPNGAMPYTGVPTVHQSDVKTYHHYAGTIPLAPTTEAGWNAPAPRSWIALVLYQALPPVP